MKTITGINTQTALALLAHHGYVELGKPARIGWPKNAPSSAASGVTFRTFTRAEGKGQDRVFLVCLADEGLSYFLRRVPAEEFDCVLEPPDGEEEGPITTSRVSVEKGYGQQAGTVFVMVGDGPTPRHIIQFKSADVCENTLNEAMAQLRNMEGQRCPAPE